MGNINTRDNIRDNYKDFLVTELQITTHFFPTLFCLYQTFHDEHVLLGEKATIKDL